MTVSITTTESSAYSGNGSTTAFSTGFAFDEDSWVKVYVYDSAGDRTLKTITTHYTLSGEGTGSAGTVTFLTAPASGETVKIFKVPTLTQTQDYTNGSGFPNELTETALDKLTHGLQYLQSQLNRVLKLTGTSTISDLEIPDLSGNAGKAMIVNPDGDGYIYADITSSDSVVILDEDDMVSDSATSVPSQQSTKAYVDAQVSGAGGGSVEWIATATPSGASEVEFTLPDDYKYFEVIIEELDNSASGALYLQVSPDGVTYDSGSSDYETNYTGAADPQLYLTGITGANSGIFGKIRIFGAKNANTYTAFTCRLHNRPDLLSNPEATGSRLNNQTEDSIRIYPNTGTFSGTLYLYGYKTS